MKKLYLLILSMLTVFSVLNAQPNNILNSTSSAAISSLTLSGVSFPDKPDQIQNSVHSLVNEPGNVAEDVTVTFQVDVKNEFVSNDSVLIIASWNDWTPMMMTANGTVYSISATLPMGTEQQYKFIKGLNDWETVTDPSCTAEGNDNRLLIVPDTDTTLPVVCYGECGTCISWYAPQHTIREVQGEGDVTPYLDQDIKTEGVITAINQYGAYIQDTSDFRSGLFVYEPNLINQYSRGQSVHFIATATEYGGLTELAGVQLSQFSEKQYAVTPLNIQITDIGEETEGVLTSLSNVEVLYQDVFSQYVVRNGAGDTAIISNYLYQPFLEIGSSYNLTGVVDYRHNKYMLEPRDRDDLQNLTHPPVEVTFRVDMQNETVSLNGVHLNGSFVDWSEEIEMNVVSEQIYSVTLTLAVGETFTYKFVNGGTFEWEYYEIPPEKCTTGENNDREITVPETNLVLDIVCFNSCYNCDKPDELNISINKTLDPPLIDGFPDNIWDKADAVPIERDFTGENPTVTASWKAMYDDDNIYVLVEVQDDDHYPAWEAGSEEYWNYDQTELFFDVNNLLLDGFGPSTAGSGHWVFSEAMQEAGYGNPQVSYALASPVTWYYTLSGQNYTLEYAFPFNSLTQNDGTILDVNDFKNLGAFGFDVTIDDRDLTKDTRDRKVWQNTGELAESWVNMDDCGTISLNGETIAQDNTLKNDSLALVALYNATNGANWINNENWLNGPLATWYGVTIANDRVTELWLDNNNLSDSIPASLVQLSQLEILAIGGNGLGGSIPEELGNLGNLRYLMLWGNLLTGTIPVSLGQLSNLNILSLNGNNLTGSIPAELGFCNNLWAINLDWNFLDGEIPVELCNIENLSSANFASNNFDANSCAAITCLLSNGVSFVESPDQLQRSGYSLTNDCGTVADSTWVTFRVNMQNESINPNGIHINGSFSNWEEAVEMHQDSAAYYSAEILLAAGQTITYKFVNGGTLEWEFYEIPPGFCTVGDNNDRELYVPHSSGDHVLDVVCFAGCTDCSDNSVQQYTIQQIQGDGDVSPLNGQTVRTKGRITGINDLGFFMQDATGARNGIFVYDPVLAAQLFQGAHIELIATVSEYNGRTQLSGTQWFDYTDDSFELYIAEIEVPEIGEDYEGVFIALNNVRVVYQNQYQEYIVVSELGDTAIIDNYLMQPVMEIGESYYVYGIVDFQHGAFGVNPRAQGGVVRLYNLTFQVDMQNQEVDPSGVFVGGDWNSWMSWQDPEPMSVDGNIWSATIKLNAGAFINYKFRNGEEWETVLGDCATGDNGDRFLTMPESDLTLDLVCFNKCISCDSLNATLPEVTVNGINFNDVLCYGGSDGLIYLNYTVGDVGNITDRGILLGSVPNLLTGATKISEGIGAGNNDAAIDNLVAGAYYLCAYAENENGISYSDVEQVFIGQPDFLEMYVTENLHDTWVFYDIYGVGGVQPYMYRLTICDDQSNCIERSWQTDSYFFIIDSLAQLTNYQADLAIMDANGCINIESYSFTLAPDNSLQIDSIALVELYYATDGPNWTNNTNWLTGPLDTWYGVTVQNGRVVSVDLNNNNLVGTLPARIGKLSALQSLVLWGNQLTGELPGELGEMSSLLTLDLGYNQFVGEIPPQLGELSNLQYLFIGSGSQLSGGIPASLGQLYNLRVLALDGNQLSGSIPYELGNLISLTDLFLQGNQLSGIIPASFGGLENLNVLHLENNTFSGELPTTLCNLPLSEVNFEQNLFHIFACEVIRCLKDNGVVFDGDSLQTQLNGIELTADCILPSLRIYGIVTPVLTNGTLCSPGENETLTLRFYNDGDEAVEGASLLYLLNGDTIALESYVGTINPNDTIDYVFSVGANLQPDLYMETFILRVYLFWEGGMIGGWSSTRFINSIRDVTDAPGWTTYYTCTGLPGNMSYAIDKDKNGNVWSVSNDGAYKFDGTNWQKYTNADGLAETSNFDVFTDSRGWTWFSGNGTSAVTRYIGTTFSKIYINGSYSSCIYEDQNGNMWFGSKYGSGVARFSPTTGRWSYFSTAEYGLGDNILSIGEDVTGNLYFSSDEGITMFDGANWMEFYISDDAVQEIFLDLKGNTWFTTWNTFYRFDGSDFSEFANTGNIILNCADIAEDLYGNLWFGGDTEIVKYDGTSWTKYGIEDGLITALGGSINTISVIKGDIWAGTGGGGISRFEQPYENMGLTGLISPVRNQYSNYLYCGLSNNEPIIARIFNDGDFPVENAVIGYVVDGDTVSLDVLDFVIQPGDTVDYTFANGADFYHTDYTKLYQLKLFITENNGNPLDNTMSFSMRVDGDYEDATGWTTYNSCDGMISDISFAIAEDGDGNIWSTTFYGADRFDGSEWNTFTVNEGLSENYSWAIERDNNGNIWFAGTDAPVITRFDGQNFTYYPQPGIFQECIYQASNGDLWFGSYSGDGIIMFDGTNWTHFDAESYNIGTSILSIGEIVNGNIIISTNEGIKALNAGVWDDFGMPEFPGTITEIFYDSKGNTWLASAGLIGKFDGTNWALFDVNNGAPQYCEDISEDIYGNIWFGGGRELAMFDGAVWTKYTANDGLAAAQLGNIYAVYADSKGYVWVGTNLGGISKFEIPKDEICTSLHFQTGWNLFSTPVILEPDSIGFNFQSLIDNASLVKIQDELGNAFEDQGIFGDWDDSLIKPLRPYDGFKINVSRNDSVQFCGRQVTYPYPIFLYEGWNIMGYPQTVPVDAAEVIQDLIDKGSLLKVQDEAGSSIEDLGVFGGWTNFMGNMVSGEGYKIKVSTKDTLWIYETYPKSTLVERPKVQPLHFAAEYRGNGVDHMNLNVVDLPIQMLAVGDELAVYDGAVCVGAVTLQPENMENGVVSVAVSAADTYGMPGFGEGNAYTLRLWQQKTRIEQRLEPDILKGPAVFAKHESAILSLKNFSDIEEGMVKEESVNCYPNPFNTKLVIEANFSGDRTVEIRILNQLGQEINYLVNKQVLNTGIHRWIWNGDNGSGQKVEPGIYYIRLSAGDKIVVNKVVLTK